METFEKRNDFRKLRVDLMLCGVQADVFQRLQFSWFINIFIEFFEILRTGIFTSRSLFLHGATQVQKTRRPIFVTLDCRVRTEECSHALNRVATDWTYAFVGG